MATLIPRATVLVLALFLAGCYTAPNDLDTQALPDPAPPLPELDFIASENGNLSLNLVEQKSTVTVNGVSYTTNAYKTIHDGKTYENSLIPPVWRLNPGDMIQLQLADERPMVGNGTCKAGGQYHHDYTNLHFHGFNVPAQNPEGEPAGDNVFIQLYPKGTPGKNSSMDYEIKLGDDHPQGLFWFHPHPHGCSNKQVMGGMSGAIVVGDLPGVHYPKVVYTRERVMLLRDFFPVAPDGPDIPDPPVAGIAATDGTQIMKTLNGATLSAFSIAPGETQFWRFANTGANLHFDMVLVDANEVPVPFYVIAVDGNVLQNPVKMDNLFLYPGSRLEGFLVGPPEGVYTLKTTSVQRNAHGAHDEPLQILALVTSAGTAPKTTPGHEIMGMSIVDTDTRYDELRTWIYNDRPTVKRTINFTVTHIGGDKYPTINDKQYDPDRNDVVANYGDIEVWTLNNPSNAPHVFHIHQLDFLVLNVNGVPVGAGGLQDTVFVPAKGVVQIAIPFTEEHTVGRYVFHCHYLPHEDRGMMANILVVDPAAP